MLRQSCKKLVGHIQLQSQLRAAGVARNYHERVVDHYNNPRNVGSFDKNDPNVGTGLVGAPACGDVMKLQIRVDDKTGKIVDARFKTFGCGSAIASSSVGMILNLFCFKFDFYSIDRWDFVEFDDLLLIVCFGFWVWLFLFCFRIMFLAF